jgi:hypothetical protein
VYRALERIIIAVCAAAFGVVILVASLLANHSKKETQTGFINQAAVGQVTTFVVTNK